jgi:signal peptidase I
MRRLAILRSALGPALLAGLGALALAGCGSAAHTESTDVAVVTVPAAEGTRSAAGSSTAPQSTTPTTSTAASTTTARGARSASAAAHATATAPGTQKSVHAATTVAHDPSSSTHRSDAKAVSHHTSTTHAGAHRKGPPLEPAANVPGGGAPSAKTGIPYEVTSISMTPTYQPEAKVYYNPSDTHPQVGEVVLFYLPVGAKGAECGTVEAGGEACPFPRPGLTQQVGMKRVVGLPGDTIAIEQGQVIRDGQPEPEPPTIPCQMEGGCEFPTPITVPAGYYFVMSDDRELFHEDSRVFGPIPQAAIIGTVEGS